MAKAYIAPLLRSRVADAAKQRCGYCRTSRQVIGPLLEIDHIVPESLGGSSEEDNLWLACPLCKHELVAGSVAETRVGYCARCRGSLANRESFAGVVRALRSRAQTPAVEPRPVDHRQLKR